MGHTRKVFYWILVATVVMVMVFVARIFTYNDQIFAQNVIIREIEIPRNKIPINKIIFRGTNNESIHHRFNIKTDTRPKIIFGNSDLYNDIRQFDDLNKVPHIIHQFYHAGQVSVIYQKWMRSWLKMNPGWQYWFWTEQDMESFIRTRYPNFQKTFENYAYDIQRYDTFRYFLLYEYGGFYTDLDVECVKPLENKLAEHNCMMSVEPAIHSLINYDDKDRLISTAIIACQPRHPFFEFVINRLIKDKRNELLDINLSSGPRMLDTSYNEFRKAFPDESPHVAEYDVFQPLSDPRLVETYASECQEKASENFSHVRNMEKAKKACAPFLNDIPEQPSNNSLTVHYWVHQWLPESGSDEHGLNNEERTFEAIDLYS